jgi:hypothetical protein
VRVWEGEGMVIFNNGPPADFSPASRRPSGDIGCYGSHYVRAEVADPCENQRAIEAPYFPLGSLGGDGTLMGLRRKVE